MPFINSVMYRSNFAVTVLTAFCLVPLFSADTPANCTYEDARGTWEFSVCETMHKCQQPNVRVFNLLYPNIANDDFGNVGTWTLIYNQGFEVTVAHRKWLVMFAYESSNDCDRGLPSQSHDTLNRQWKWFSSKKIKHRPSDAKRHVQDRGQVPLGNQGALFVNNHDVITQINSGQSLWKAAAYPHFEKFTLKEMQRISGGMKSIFSTKHRVKRQENSISPELFETVNELPGEFSWLHPPSGRPSPVTPVRAQLRCGSCYAFASAAALESRIRLVSNFTRTPILSPQEIVDCGNYSEGCDGGFPYLVAGKYAEDYGFVEESCLPYKGVHSSACVLPANCTRYYTTNYAYIGGYYGACNEMLMKLELVTGGPFSIGFEVYDDFKYYNSGVYRHTGISDGVNRFNPFELTNHAVLLVGYGVDVTSNTPYWLVKNSWGPDWGEKGFFRIVRGQDECAIESLGVRFDPVL